MLDEKTWDEFRETGLLCWVNMILHAFGWCITCEVNDEGKTTRVFPARTKFRGFSNKSTSDAYIKISKYMKENADTLLEEAEE